MRRITVAIFMMMMIAGAVIAGAAFDGEDKKPVTNKNCPVSGGPVVAKYRTEYKGQYVYVCCQGCLDEFNKTPDAFVAKLPKEDQEALKINTACPVTKEPIDNALWVEDEGRKIYFCCNGCVAKYKKDHPTAKSN